MTFINTSVTQEHRLPVEIGVTYHYNGKAIQIMVHYIDDIEIFDDFDRLVFSPRHNIIFKFIETGEMYLLQFDADHPNGDVRQFDTTKRVPLMGIESVFVEHGIIAPNDDGEVLVKAMVNSEPQPVRVGMAFGAWVVALVEKKLLVLRNGNDIKVIYHDKIPDEFSIKWSK